MGTASLPAQSIYRNVVFECTRGTSAFTGGADSFLKDDAAQYSLAPPVTAGERGNIVVENSGMRVGIIGTSNSILKGGYTAGLASFDSIEVVRVGTVGESLGMLYAVLFDEAAARTCDCCILDFAVNEEIYVRESGLPLQVIEDYLFAIVAKLWSLDVLPVFLLLPRRSVTAEASTIRGIYSKIAGELELPLFDAIAVIDAIALQSGRNRELCFKDDGHLHPWCGFGLGLDIGGFIMRLNGRPWRRTERAWSAFRYDNLPVTRCELTSSTFGRSTNLVSVRMTQLTPETPFIAHTELGAELVGTYFSLVETAAIIGIRGDVVEYYDLSTGYRLFASGFYLAIQAFHRPIASAKGSFVVSVEPRENFNLPQTKHKPVVLIPQGKRYQNDDFAVLGGFVVRSPKQDVLPSRPAGYARYNFAPLMENTRAAVLAYEG